MNKITEIPSSAEIKDKEKSTKEMVKAIEKATDGHELVSAFKDKVKNQAVKEAEKKEKTSEKAEAKKEVKKEIKELSKTIKKD